MLFKNYLNKPVVIWEKLYSGPSSMYTKGIGKSFSAGTTNIDEGVLTGVYDTFIELDNNTLISIDHIYKIKLQ